MDGMNDPLLAEKLNLLSEMEDRIRSKNAFIAKQSVERSTHDTLDGDEQLYTSKATPLRDRVHFILQQRETRGFLSKLASQRERATLLCLSEDPVMDHPLKMRLKALMRRRSIQSKEFNLHSPPSQSPPTQDNEVERGFDFFLSLLNNGADMECNIPLPHPQRSVSPPSHCDHVRHSSKNFHCFSPKEVNMDPDSAQGCPMPTVCQPAYQKNASEDPKHFHGLQKKAMDKVPDIIPTPLQRSSPPIQKENLSTDIRKKEDEVRDMPPAVSRRSHSPSARHGKNSLIGKELPEVPRKVPEKVRDATPPTGQTASQLPCSEKVNQGLDRFVRLLQKEFGLRNTVMSTHPPPPRKSLSPPNRRDEDSGVLKRAINEGEEEIPHRPSAPLQRSVSPLVQKNSLLRVQKAMPARREAKSPDSAPPAPPPSVNSTVAEDKSERGFQLFLSLLNNGADMVPDILTMPRHRSSSPPRQKDQVRGFHNEGEKGDPNLTTPPPKSVSPNRRKEFSRGLKRPLDPGAVSVPNVSSAPPHQHVSPSTKQEKVSKGFECFLSLLNKGVDMEQLQRIVNEPRENHLSGVTSDLNIDTTSQECKRRGTNDLMSRDQSPHLGGSEAAVKRQIDREDCSGKPGFQSDSLPMKKYKDDSDQTESSLTSRTAVSVEARTTARSHSSRSPVAKEDERQTRAETKCPLVEKKTGIESQHFSSQTLKDQHHPSDTLHLQSTTPVQDKRGAVQKANKAGQAKRPKSLTRAAKANTLGLDDFSRSRSKSPLPRKSKGKASSKSQHSLDSRSRSKSPWAVKSEDKSVSPEERRRSRHKSHSPEKKVVEVKGRSDDKQVQLQSILSSLGLDLEAKDLSGVAARTQERLYGKKTDNKTVSGSSLKPEEEEEKRSADKSGRSRDRSLSRGKRRSHDRRSSSASPDRTRPRDQRDSRDRRSPSWSPQSRSRSPCHRFYDRIHQDAVERLPVQSYGYSYGSLAAADCNPYAPAGEPSVHGMGHGYDFRRFSAPVYPADSYGHIMEYAGGSQLAYAHYPPYPSQQYCQPPVYNPGNPFIQNFQYPACMPASSLGYPPQHQEAVNLGLRKEIGGKKKESR
ncbi:serine/arginine repetitive matrix protein 5-like [Synchiropus splendidus]|uniref:serine/arginine repetitive matrix protein 5-like n=1 Tax=Synchiropus splendidus TaxID=270530 RepID=UPI00237E8BA5|nr:serine/arginine repetitive matrix protein 5-like [Synchiropus splendidus]XP_053711015.1 serine/arginine repetitive matrix protein 5-like [Synchiropus splendidus]XP_053711016.1 serine/arginine repetitive matrix protein 5-like [Synchiropus splendidus]XP_053711017.1 serine/arginine repetitive matrix protein 5-like [Synchiropus splendidus]XP_053711019.1 serine/arginine repetitive matrix protein 5-like [Synchiropus splendidus]